MTDSAGHLGIGDRLSDGPAPELVDSAFAAEISYGPWLYRGMSLADLAHAVLLIEAGVITTALGARLVQALLDLHAIPAQQFLFDPARGDAYGNREAELRQRAAEAADWLQAGRARREASTVGYLITVRIGLLTLAEALLGMQQALLDLAASHVNTLMPDYTYLQTAQPTTLAHYLLTFVQPITRDLQRLQLAYDHTNRSPAGIGSTNGSNLPINRERLAQLLGFDGLVCHTRDAMWQPDGPVEIMAALTACLLNMDRLAEDLQIWATAEFNYIELADTHSRISVIMPQKKNPYGLAYVRGAARDVIGKLVSAATLQATPSGQVDNRIFVYSGVPQALEQATQALRLFAGIVANLRVNAPLMRQRAQEQYSGATDLADTILLTFGLSARVAHRIVGRAVRLAGQTGQTLDAALLDEAALAIIKRPLRLSDQFISNCMNPETIVASRKVAGGAAPEPVRAMLAAFEDHLRQGRAWVAAQKQILAEAEHSLLAAAEALCQRT
jgi:argininosuccinate lyase